MRKINFKGLATKTAGLAAGTVAAGFVQKGIAKIGLNGIMSNVAIMAVGALGPDLLGQKSPLMMAAGDAIMTLGIQGVIKSSFPNLPLFIAGVDDVAGPYDEVAGAYGDYEVGEVDEPGFVSGPDDSAEVAGNAL